MINLICQTERSNKNIDRTESSQVWKQPWA